MKAPYNWIREYVPDAPDIGTAEHLLTMSGTKVEALHPFGVPPDAGGNGDGSGYRVGRVSSFEQHPNADRLRLCRVDVGDGELRQIVCGASNFSEGDTVAVVLPGSTLPGGHRVDTASLRGVESHGMMLSERELELSQDHAGIMILPAEWRIGADLGEYLPLGDTVVEFEITSNRPDCLGVLGIARELATVAQVELADPTIGDAEATAGGSVDDHVSVELAAPDLCPRYMARAFVDVKVGASPHWMRARLAAAGMRAINNVVDVTNYVMLVTGQPLHAFDADQLRGARIVVRRARDGEVVTTLDAVKRTLDRSMLSIADAEQTAVIAGVMGAADVEVGEATTRLVLEAACFDGPTIKRTSMGLGLRSESSSRFEKGLDPYSPDVAMRMASRLLVELCGASLVPGTIDARAPSGLPQLPIVELSATLPGEVHGVEIPEDVCEQVLMRLGYGLTRTGEASWTVAVPHWRMRDTRRAIDLVEEVGRVFGLDKVPATLPATRGLAGGLSRGQLLQRMLEDTAVGLGLRETNTYSLAPQGSNERLGVKPIDIVRVSNQMTNDHVELRASCVGSLLEVVRRNRAAGADDIAVFEVSRNFRRGNEGGTLPTYAREQRVFVLCCAGDVWGAEASFNTASGLVHRLLQTVGIAHELRPPAKAQPYLHPGQSADVVLGDGVIAGWAGLVHPGLVASYALRGDVAMAELHLYQLEAALPDVHRFGAFSTFPPVRQDIAVVLPANTLAGDVVATVKRAAGDLLESVRVFDRYEGDPIAEGHYSLALRLVFRAIDRTLTDDEVANVRGGIVEQLASLHGAVLREG